MSSRFTSVRRRVAIAAIGACASFAPACVGDIGDVPGGGNDPTGKVRSEIGESGLRRLTAAEYDATIYELVGLQVDSETSLPEDLRSPYDNDFTEQLVSASLIDAAESLAGAIAGDVLTSTMLRDSIVPCAPSEAADASCFNSFVRQFGRRALRRPITDEEVSRLAILLQHGADDEDFWTAIDSAMRFFLQHPEFLYRVEIGTPVAKQEGVYRLNDYELATRLSYFLWGTNPPDWLLDAAAAGDLSTPDGIANQASKLMDDDRAKKQVARFHSLWLGYEKLPISDAIADDVRAETQALLDKVIFEERGPWVDLLTAKETFITSELATLYDLPAPSGSGAGWVPYGDSGRQGLFSQASFLSAVAKFGDTSPTQRGLLIQTRLFCQTIEPPPPELNVNVDEPPPSSDPNACKQDRYNMWQREGCENCHQLTDPVGFGLENYDAVGQYRDHDPGRPECVITGEGTLKGVGTFKGPAELADLMAASPGVNSCVAKQVYRYAMGRFDLKLEDNRALLGLVESATDERGLIFYDLMIELAKSPAFRHRREEVSP